MARGPLSPEPISNQARDAQSQAHVPSSVTKDTTGYVLKRDYAASCRLNLQHFLFSSTIGFNLHPNITITSLPPTPRVADIATGTGIWIVETLPVLPADTQFDGFDIDLSQTPHPQWLPSNISLREWNMFDEVPSELVGVYDVVHVRNIMVTIKDGNPVPVVQNLRKLLKPGGYFQWDEINMGGKTVVKVSEDRACDAINTMFNNEIPQHAKESFRWQSNVDSTLKEHGFGDIEAHLYNPPPILARYWHEVYMLAWDEVLASGRGFSASEARRIADQGMDELKNGAAVSFPVKVWTARAC